MKQLDYQKYIEYVLTRMKPWNNLTHQIRFGLVLNGEGINYEILFETYLTILMKHIKEGNFKIDNGKLYFKSPNPSINQKQEWIDVCLSL